MVCQHDFQKIAQNASKQIDNKYLLSKFLVLDPNFSVGIWLDVSFYTKYLIGDNYNRLSNLYVNTSATISCNILILFHP